MSDTNQWGSPPNEPAGPSSPSAASGPTGIPAASGQPPAPSLRVPVKYVALGVAAIVALGGALVYAAIPEKTPVNCGPKAMANYFGEDPTANVTFCDGEWMVANGTRFGDIDAPIYWDGGWYLLDEGLTYDDEDHPAGCYFAEDLVYEGVPDYVIRKVTTC